MTREQRAELIRRIDRRRRRRDGLPPNLSRAEVEAIRRRLERGEPEEDVATDLGLTIAVVRKKRVVGTQRFERDYQSWLDGGLAPFRA